MPNNPIGFKVTNATAGWSNADFDTIFARKDCFLEGGLWAWGRNSYGILGNNNTTNMSSPVQTISGGTNWKQVSGGGIASAAIKTDGTLWTWGSNLYGALGNNLSSSYCRSPVQTVAAGNNWKQVCVNPPSPGFHSHTIAIKTDGTLWLWGRNSCGQLGTNSIVSQSSPVQTVSGGNNWKQASLGTYHSAAIKTDGTLWLWGSGTGGQLGNDSSGGTNRRSSPIQTISGGTNWKQVSAAYLSTAAIKTDGTLWTWGLNNNGLLGDGTNTQRLSPVQTISGGSNWKQVSAGTNNTAAIKTDGTLWVWGQGALGALGNNSTTAVSSPVQTISGGTNWKQVNTGRFTVTGIKTDGTLWLWGYNSTGQLGDNSQISKSSPVQTISGGTNWRQVCFNGVSILSIREDCW